VEQESLSEAVALRAERGRRVLTWDAHPIVAEQLKQELESQGWTVSLSTDGPHRRRMPRMEQARF